MNEAILFKILHRQLKFRNPNHWLQRPAHFVYSAQEFNSAKNYLLSLDAAGISWTYPGHQNYPKQFTQMKEPPLFFEYKGRPLWTLQPCLSVVGTRQIHSQSQEWIKTQFVDFLKKEKVCVVSGGAYGVDQLVHQITLKEGGCTIVVVPSGLIDIYPGNLLTALRFFDFQQICFVSEFETGQTLHKSHFFYRNRLIAAFGVMTLMIQAEIKSGSLLTVHHALENGRQVLTLPAHPVTSGFSGNIKLLQDGAYLVSSSLDLLEIWNGEIMSNPVQMEFG